MLQSQRPAAPMFFCPKGPQLPPKPPSLGCYRGTRQGKGAETQLVGPWQDPTVLQVWRAWLGVGSVDGQGCGLSSPWFITPGRMVTVAMLEEPISWLTEQPKNKWQKPLSLHLTRRLEASVSFGCAVPVPQGRHTLHSWSCPTPLWAGHPHPAMAWGQIICIKSPSPSFPSEAIVYLSPLALTWSKLQSKAAENNLCICSLWCSPFPPLAHYSTCNLKIYLFIISAVDMVFLLVFSLKPVTGSFCYLPNFFCFDSIFLALHNPCKNCKYL